jgi:glycosyltransferase involved in cell wall biosynthesis
MRVSLVVPLRNEESTLPALIASIEGQTRRPDEVLLVDGSSTDRTVAVAHELTRQAPRYRIVEAGPATPGRGRNVGIAAAQYEWIALTDAGIRLEPTWLAELIAVAGREPGVEVVYGNYEPDTASFFEECAALAYVPPRQRRPVGSLRAPSIASTLLRREVWQQVGGFPDWRAAEDLWFLEAIDRHGYRVGWAPAATVHWQLAPTLARTFRRFALYSKHNVWAGRQRYWHHGVARQYVAAALVGLLALVHSPWWLCALLVGALARVAKRIAAHREGRSIGWLFHPLRFALVALILATLDLATFVGWVQALRRPRPGTDASTSSPQEMAQDSRGVCGLKKRMDATP